MRLRRLASGGFCQCYVWLFVIDTRENAKPAAEAGAHQTYSYLVILCYFIKTKMVPILKQAEKGNALQSLFGQSYCGICWLKY